MHTKQADVSSSALPLGATTTDRSLAWRGWARAVGVPVFHPLHQPDQPDSTHREPKTWRRMYMNYVRVFSAVSRHRVCQHRQTAAHQSDKNGSMLKRLEGKNMSGSIK